MKTIPSFLTMILAVAVFQSCKKEESATTAPKAYLQLEKAKWFLGEWDNTINNAHFTEIWKQKNDSTLYARSFIIEDKDTVFSEEAELIQRNDSLFYIVNVKGQNNEKPVSFYMTATSKNEVVFENPTRDFPTKITYTRFSENRISAAVSGLRNGKQTRDDYPMKRRER